jgi:MFS transporter, DHA3 family, macrolide efflux protein
MTPSPAAPRSMKTFLIIWLGQFVSLLGSGLTNFALGVWIFEQSQQATPFALTVLFAQLPRILLAPLAGVLVDRWNRRTIMILADCGNALVTLATAVLLFSGTLAVWHIYLIALTSAIFMTFQEPAYTASITMLVPEKHLARASGLGQLAQSVEMLLVPVLAGLLFVAIGLQGIILLDFVTFFVAIGALLFVRIPQPDPEKADAGQERSMWRDAAYGWNYLRARRGLFLLVWYFALVNFLLNFASVLVTPLVLSFGDASTLGLVQMMSGAGMLLGSVIVSVWGGPRNRVLGSLGFIFFSSLGLTVVGFHPSLLFVGGGFFLLMLGVPISMASSQALFQSRVAPAVQGRVFAMRGMIARSMMPLAFLSAGLLADGLFEPLMLDGGLLASTLLGDLFGVGQGRGIGLMISLAGALLIAVSALALGSPGLRSLEAEPPGEESGVPTPLAA